MRESTDADGRPFRLIQRVDLLNAELGCERIGELLEGRQEVVSRSILESRGDLQRVANALRAYFVGEGICPACAFPLRRVPLAGDPPGYWWICNECGRRWW